MHFHADDADLLFVVADFEVLVDYPEDVDDGEDDEEDLAQFALVVQDQVEGEDHLVQQDD